MQPDILKDQLDHVMSAIDRAIMKADIIKSVLPSNAIQGLLEDLGLIKKLYPPNFKAFILSQVVEDGKIIDGDVYLSFADTAIKITVECVKNIPEYNVKKKWYNFK